MYLVCDDDDAVFAAQRAYPRESVPVPENSPGVLGIAQEKQRGLRVREFFLKPCEINAVCAVFVKQGAFDDIPAIIANGVEKDIVHRRHDEHIFTNGGEFAHYA